MQYHKKYSEFVTSACFCQWLWYKGYFRYYFSKTFLQLLEQNQSWAGLIPEDALLSLGKSRPNKKKASSQFC